jgi:hypothetical protein
MSNIHFFPGSALIGLIMKKKLSHDAIQQAFQKIKTKETNHPHDLFFQEFFIYSAEQEINIHTFKKNDVIVAGSRGGLLAHQFIQFHAIVNPMIVAFEALGLIDYGQQVWHFISQQGERFAHVSHRKYRWDDKDMSHNCYMLHPDMDNIIGKNADPIRITEWWVRKKNEPQEYFYLFDQVAISHSQTGIQKKVRNILMRCNEKAELIIPPNHYDQVCLNMDVIIGAAFARVNNSLESMPDGFRVKSISSPR